MADGNVELLARASLTPPMKWAGGKRWLINRIAPALNVPFTRLIEPFAGSAATFFRLRPQQAILADVNSELLNVYASIKANHREVYQHLIAHSEAHSSEYYYKTRATIPSCPIAQAARTLYLNRTCWNGLYRVNLSGQFNVPKGTKDKVLLPTDNFGAVSIALKSATILVSDFEDIVRQAGIGDFIFADPPYFSRTVSGTFVKYTKGCFNWADQERLATAMIAAHKRGAHFLLTNVDAPELEELYRSDGHVTRTSRASVISGKASSRGQTSELLWTSFPLTL